MVRYWKHTFLSQSKTHKRNIYICSLSDGNKHLLYQNKWYDSLPKQKFILTVPEGNTHLCHWMKHTCFVPEEEMYFVFEHKCSVLSRNTHFLYQDEDTCSVPEGNTHPYQYTWGSGTDAARPDKISNTVQVSRGDISSIY